MIKPTHSRGQQLCEFLTDTVIVILIIISSSIITITIFIIIIIITIIIIIIIIILLYFILFYISIKKGNSFRVVLGLVGKKHRSQVQVNALFINLL